MRTSTRDAMRAETQERCQTVRTHELLTALFDALGAPVGRVDARMPLRRQQPDGSARWRIVANMPAMRAAAVRTLGRNRVHRCGTPAVYAG